MKEVFKFKIPVPPVNAQEWCKDLLGANNPGWSIGFHIDPINFDGWYYVTLYDTLEPDLLTYCKLTFKEFNPRVLKWK